MSALYTFSRYTFLRCRQYLPHVAQRQSVGGGTAGMCPFQNGFSFFTMRDGHHNIGCVRWSIRLVVLRQIPWNVFVRVWYTYDSGWMDVTSIPCGSIYMLASSMVVLVVSSYLLGIIICWVLILPQWTIPEKYHLNDAYFLLPRVFLHNTTHSLYETGPPHHILTCTLSTVGTVLVDNPPTVPP